MTNSVREALRSVYEELVILPAPAADQTRVLIDAAVATNNVELILREGNSWSGKIGPAILHLADCVENENFPQGE